MSMYTRIEDNIMLMTIFRLFLHEATMRLMAGASPNKTQELLARSRDSRSRVTSR